jgi:hypothetical protein
MCEVFILNPTDIRVVAFFDADAFARRLERSLIWVRGSGQGDRVLKLTGLLERLEIIDLSGGPDAWR